MDGDSRGPRCFVVDCVGIVVLVLLFASVPSCFAFEGSSHSSVCRTVSPYRAATSDLPAVSAAPYRAATSSHSSFRSTVWRSSILTQRQQHRIAQQILHFMELAAIGGVGTSLVLVAATSEGEVGVKSGQIKNCCLTWAILP